MTTLYKTSHYKLIEFDKDQLALSITVLEKFMNEERKSIEFFTDKLNSSDTTKDVRDYTNSIKMSKSRITELSQLVEQMASNEFIIKHTF